LASCPTAEPEERGEDVKGKNGTGNLIFCLSCSLGSFPSPPPPVSNKL
jgi:hypothetical protein